MTTYPKTISDQCSSFHDEINFIGLAPELSKKRNGKDNCFIDWP
jgi:hypothetical protein